MLMYYRDIFYQFTGNLIIVRSFVGNLIVKVVGLLETDIVPLCCSIIFLQNGKPSPVPEAFVLKSESKINASETNYTY